MGVPPGYAAQAGTVPKTLSRNAGEGGPSAEHLVGEGISPPPPSPSHRFATGPSLSRSAGEGLLGRLIQNPYDVARFAAGAFGDLVAAAGAAGGEQRLGRRRAHLGQDAQFADLHRHLVCRLLLEKKQNTHASP